MYVSKDADCMLTRVQDGIHLMSAQKNVECTCFATIWSHLARSPYSSGMKLLLDIKQKLGLCHDVDKPNPSLSRVLDNVEVQSSSLIWMHDTTQPPFPGKKQEDNFYFVPRRNCTTVERYPPTRMIRRHLWNV
jgi:hypothetical protein